MAISDPDTLEGRNVHGAGGEKLGKIDAVYLDQETGRPEWAAVKTGLFGGHVSLVPLSAAQQSGEGDITVPFDKDQIKNAPHSDPDAELSPQDEKDLFRHYGIPYGGDTVTATGGPQGGGTTEGFVDRDRDGRDDRTEARGTVGRGTEGYDTSGPTTDEAMTRSEERLSVGTQQVEAGKARLRKYIVTEQVTQTVPVSHEEVRIEREPITEANRGNALDGPDLSEEEHEVVLHAERPVVQKETVPVERVRLGTETVTEQQQVTEQVRKEQVETEGLDRPGNARTTDER